MNWKSKFNEGIKMTDTAPETIEELKAKAQQHITQAGVYGYQSKVSEAQRDHEYQKILDIDQKINALKAKEAAATAATSTDAPPPPA